MSARLAYAVHGPDSAPPLVLLHALATSAELWRPQLPAWSACFRVICVDLPGHGASPLATDMASLGDAAREVAAVLDELGIASAALLGLSWGGMVAQAFALAFPQRCRALVMAHTSARTDDSVKKLWDDRLAQLAREGLPAQVAPTLARWFPEDFAAASPLTLDWVAGLIRATPPAGYAAAIRSIQQLDHLDSLHRIEAPTLIIAGEQDMAAPPAVAQGMAGQMTQARLAVLPGVAHLGNVQAPVLFTETAGGFLQEVLAR